MIHLTGLSCMYCMMAALGCFYNGPQLVDLVDGLVLLFNKCGEPRVLHDFHEISPSKASDRGMTLAQRKREI